MAGGGQVGSGPESVEVEAERFGGRVGDGVERGEAENADDEGEHRCREQSAVGSRALGGEPGGG